MRAVVRKLSIMLHDDGSVTVEGPIEDKVLCYGLLGFARDQVQSFKPTTIAIATQLPQPGEVI